MDNTRYSLRSLARRGSSLPGRVWPCKPSLARLSLAVRLAVLVGAIGLLAAREPTTVRAIPPCPFRLATGLYCPGCGSLRATHHALHGRLGRAWSANPAMVVVGFPALAVYGVGLVAGLKGSGAGAPRRRWHPALGWAAAAGLVIFGVLRNIPGAPFDRLRPAGAFEAGVEGG